MSTESSGISRIDQIKGLCLATLEVDPEFLKLAIVTMEQALREDKTNVAARRNLRMFKALKRFKEEVKEVWDMTMAEERHSLTAGSQSTSESSKPSSESPSSDGQSSPPSPTPSN